MENPPWLARTINPQLQSGRVADANRPTKPFFRPDEADLKQTRDSVAPDQQRGSIMWSLIISLLYEQSCKQYLADMLRHQHRWI